MQDFTIPTVHLETDLVHKFKRITFKRTKRQKSASLKAGFPDQHHQSLYLQSAIKSHATECSFNCKSCALKRVIVAT